MTQIEKDAAYCIDHPDVLHTAPEHRRIIQGIYAELTAARLRIKALQTQVAPVPGVKPSKLRDYLMSMKV